MRDPRGDPAAAASRGRRRRRRRRPRGAGHQPAFVPNADFYRIDTALLVPQVDAAGWTLQVTGMVDRPFELHLRRAAGHAAGRGDVTLSCVSNEVGGDLVGNAVWQGVPLTTLLDRAGVQPERRRRSSAARSTASPPASRRGRDRRPRPRWSPSRMNGEPLPARARLPGPPRRGRAVRLRVGHQVADGDRADDAWTTFDGYWIPRGWSKERPDQDRSRASTCPRSGDRSPPARQPVAGVAWAPTRGIAAVEVQVDDGPWQRASSRQRRRRHVAAVAPTLGRAPGRPHDRGAGHRRDGRDADEERAPAAERRHRLPHQAGHRSLGQPQHAFQESIHQLQCGMSLARSRASSGFDVVVGNAPQVDLHMAAGAFDHAVLGPVRDPDLAWPPLGERLADAARINDHRRAEAARSICRCVWPPAITGASSMPANSSSTSASGAVEKFLRNECGDPWKQSARPASSGTSSSGRKLRKKARRRR